jgi:hypothetical protein
MNCTRAKSEIALWVGGDVDNRDTEQLRRHVALCSECREYRSRMAGSLRVLQEPATPAAYNLHDSVWPNVQSRLSVQSQVEADRAERLNRWLPAAAIAVACLAVIAITSEPQPRHQRLDGRPLLSDGLIWQPSQPTDLTPVVGWQVPNDELRLPGMRPLSQHDRSVPGDESWLAVFKSLTEHPAPNDHLR